MVVMMAMMMTVEMAALLGSSRESVSVQASGADSIEAESRHERLGVGGSRALAAGCALGAVGARVSVMLSPSSSSD